MTPPLTFGGASIEIYRVFVDVYRLIHLSDDKCHDLSTGTFGVLLQFGFGTDSTRKWVARQVVPPTWILSGVEVRVDGSGQQMVKCEKRKKGSLGICLGETWSYSSLGTEHLTSRGSKTGFVLRWLPGKRYLTY